jgi:hypothetical protein
MDDIATKTHVRCGPASPRGRRMPKRAPLTALGANPHFRGSPNLRLGCKARIVFGVVGIFAGAYACLSSAVAEVEEDTGQDVRSSGYSENTLSSNTMTNLIFDSTKDGDVLEYLQNLENSHADIEYLPEKVESYTSGHPAFFPSKKLNGLDDALIPETVWSLDGSAGVHLDRILGGPGTDISTAFGGRPEITDFWVSAIFGPLSSNNADKASDLLPLPFQVASCGGNSAEHSNLDYCDDAAFVIAQLDSKPKKSSQDNNDSAAQLANNGLSSSVAPASDSSAPTNIAALAPVPGAQSLLPGTLSLLGPCGDTSASCTNVLIDVPETVLIDVPETVLIDVPETLVDTSQISLPSPVEELTPPIDPPNSEAPPSGPVLYVNDPEPVLDLPPYIPPQPPRPIPEASTWVMTITGFITIFFVFGKKRRPRPNPISIIDVSQVY